MLKNIRGCINSQLIAKITNLLFKPKPKPKPKHKTYTNKHEKIC